MRIYTENFELWKLQDDGGYSMLLKSPDSHNGLMQCLTEPSTPCIASSSHGILPNMFAEQSPNWKAPGKGPLQKARSFTHTHLEKTMLNESQHWKLWPRHLQVSCMSLHPLERECGHLRIILSYKHVWASFVSSFYPFLFGALPHFRVLLPSCSLHPLPLEEQRNICD